jgi:NAD(P)-dependent dehydrogenase (short-subunit alcohol dehydrogenase family)
LLIKVLVSYFANRLYFKGGVCKSKKRLDGKVVIITGANTGIGYETALDFAYRGAHLILACRDSKKAEKSAKEIIKLTNNKNVDVEFLDLSDLDTVRSFAAKMNKNLSRLDILVNNAGNFLFSQVIVCYTVMS